MKIKVFLFLCVLFLVACQPSPEQLAGPVAATIAAFPTATPYPTYTSYPSQTPFSTYTPEPTYTPLPTLVPVIMVITATSSPTPIYTPTETPDPLYADKSAGFYLIGVDIAPGIWRSNGSADKCYWSITTKTGDIIDNHYGMAGGTMYVPGSGYQVELKDNCGTWTYLGE